MKCVAHNLFCELVYIFDFRRMVNRILNIGNLLLVIFNTSLASLLLLLQVVQFSLDVLNVLFLNSIVVSRVITVEEQSTHKTIAFSPLRVHPIELLFHGGLLMISLLLDLFLLCSQITTRVKTMHVSIYNKHSRYGFLYRSVLCLEFQSFLVLGSLGYLRSRVPLSGFCVFLEW